MSDVDWHMFESMLQAVGEGEGPLSVAVWWQKTMRRLCVKGQFTGTQGKPEILDRANLKALKSPTFKISSESQ